MRVRRQRQTTRGVTHLRGQRERKEEERAALRPRRLVWAVDRGAHSSYFVGTRVGLHAPRLGGAPAAHLARGVLVRATPLDTGDRYSLRPASTHGELEVRGAGGRMCGDASQGCGCRVGLDPGALDRADKTSAALDSPMRFAAGQCGCMGSDRRVQPCYFTIDRAIITLMSLLLSSSQPSEMALSLSISVICVIIISNSILPEYRIIIISIECRVMMQSFGQQKFGGGSRDRRS